MEMRQNSETMKHDQIIATASFFPQMIYYLTGDYALHFLHCPAWHEFQI
jgi:hypothetical protein